MQYNVARDGKQLGQFSEAEVRAGLFDGSYLNTDLGWTDGMSDWKPLGEIFSVTPPSMPVRSTSPAPVTYNTSLSPASSGLAITSLVCGIISMLTCGFLGLGSLAAIICGHLAIGKIKAASGAIGGRGMALAGLIMGYVSLVFLVIYFVAIMASLAVPTFAKIQEKGMQTVVITNARIVVTSCDIYAASHDGKYPESLDVLLEEGLLAESVLKDPLLKDDTLPAFEYKGSGMNQDTPGEAIVLIGTYMAKDGKQIVARKDKSVELEKLSPAH